MADSLAWEAWQEEDVVSGCKTLYVLGEIESSLQKPFLRCKELPGLPPTNLVLEIASASSKRTKKLVELIYSECVCDPKKYTSITVFLGNKVIADLELEKIKIF